MDNIGKGERDRENMGISRKFAKGTIHENATGKFTIMDRFKENNIIYLEFQWLSGEKAGQVEINKEGNMNASIHKFNASRGITPAIQYTEKVEPFVEKIDEILDIVTDNKDMFAGYIEAHSKLDDKINDAIDKIWARQGYVEQLDSKMEELYKIIEHQSKMIDILIEKANQMVDRSNILNTQQDVISKLIDKID